MHEFRTKEPALGTIDILSNLVNKSPEEIYLLCKTRFKEEQVFDSFKNTLYDGSSHMLNPDGLWGWMFISFPAICCTSLC